MTNNQAKQILTMIKQAKVEWKPLGEIGELIRGNGLTKKDLLDDGVPAIHYGQIYTYYGTETNKTISFVSEELAKKLRKVDCGDVVITNTSENFDDVGKALLYSGIEQAVTGGHATIFKPSQAILGKYFVYFTQSQHFSNEKRKYAKGTKVIDVSAADMAKITIPIPPLELQKEIVRILDTFTALTSELTSELTLRQKQYQYYRDFLLSENELAKVGFEWKRLDQISENLNPMRKPIKGGLREFGNIPYYGASGIVDYVKDYIFDDDLLLISEDGANLLARNTPIAFSVSGKCWVNNHAHVLKFKTYEERRFIEFYLNHMDLSPYISGAAQPKLNKQNLNSIKFPIPDLPTQAKIVAILDKFDRLTSSITDGLPKEIELRRKQYEYYRELLLGFDKN